MSPSLRRVVLQLWSSSRFYSSASRRWFTVYLLGGGGKLKPEHGENTEFLAGLPGRRKWKE